MSINVFNDSGQNIGPILDNIKNTIVATESMLTLDVDDSITPVPISAYGKTLLDSTSLADLRSQLLENTNQEAIRLLDDGQSEINMYTSGTGASQLRLQITDSNTKINNNLLVDTIKDVAGNTAIKSTTATDTKFLKQTNTFRYDNNATGYVSIHNSNSTASGYIQWYSGDAVTAPVRNAFMGLSLDNNDGDGADLSLSMERKCNFHILKEGVSVMKFDNFNNKIVVANPLDVTNIRDVNGGDAIELNSNEVRLKKPLYIEWPHKKFSIQGGATDNVIYEKSGLNLAFNIAYTANGESETVTTAGLNTSKVLIDNTGVSLLVSNAVDALPSNVLVATNNKTQVFSQKLSVKDDAVIGGYVELERTGATTTLGGYINYYNSTGRLFYTGFNTGASKGNPTHFFEDQCLSYIFKNSLTDIMKIISHDGVTYDAYSNYIQINNRLECPNIQLSGPNNTGALYCKGDPNPLNTNADSVSLNYNLALDRATNTESVILPAEKTAKIEMNQFAIQLQMSSNVNSLPSTLFEASHLFVTTFKNLVPNANNILDIGIDDGSTLSRFRDCYLTRNLDITGTSSRVIMTDSSVADNTIRSSGVCGNTIVGVKSQTSDTGVGFLRLAAGIESTAQINETYIDLYGANSTDTYQSIRHVVNNSEMFVIDTTTAEFKNTLFTRNIFPSSAPTVSPHTASLYDIGTDVTRYRDIYLRDAPTHGSDARLKKNIVPLENSLSTVLKLQPKLFQWISSASGRNHIGFIAQDIEQIPELANTGYFCKSKDGSTMSLRSCEIIPVLSGAIQELYEIVTSSSDKPVIIKEQVKSVDHKCDNLELINQLNSYELELLDCNSKIKELDSNIEEICEDSTLLKEDNNILKIKNKGLEERIGKLEVSNKELLEKINNIDNKKDDNLLLTEDDENSGIMDIMNQRFLELEARLLKSEAKSKKLTTALNKLLKEK